MISDQDKYFGNFDIERICLDKYFFVVYDEKYCILDHPFDKLLAKKYFQNIKKSRVKARSKFVDVLRNETGFSFYELHLKGSRHLFCYCNIIQFLKQKNKISLRNEEILYKDNFFPLDSKISLEEFIDAKGEIERGFCELYKDIVKEYWGVELGAIKIKPVQLEIAYEVFPASVSDISHLFEVKGVSFRKYNTQSGTLYLDNDVGQTDIRLPDGAIMRISDDHEIFPDETMYGNKINSGYSSEKVQIKFYQKTFGLVRIELSIVNEAIKKLNQYEDYVQFVFDVFSKNSSFSESVKRFDIDLEGIVRAVSRACGITEELCYVLKDVGVWENSRQADNLRRRLQKKGLLLPVFDDIGTRKRGCYTVAPWFREIFQKFKPKGRELFLPGVLKKR